MIKPGSVPHRIIGLVATALLILILLYVSRFWIWRAPWSNEGLFGLKIVSPLGNLVHRWVQGTPLAEMSLIMWGCGAIILLSILHWLASRIIK